MSTLSSKGHTHQALHPVSLFSFLVWVIFFSFLSLCFCFFSWFLWSSDFLELDITMVELVSLLLQFTASQKVSIYSIHYIDLDPLPGADQVNGDVAFECL